MLRSIKSNVDEIKRALLSVKNDSNKTADEDQLKELMEKLTVTVVQPMENLVRRKLPVAFELQNDRQNQLENFNINPEINKDEINRLDGETKSLNIRLQRIKERLEEQKTDCASLLSLFSHQRSGKFTEAEKEYNSQLKNWDNFKSQLEISINNLALKGSKVIVFLCIFAVYFWKFISKL